MKNLLLLLSFFSMCSCLGASTLHEILTADFIIGNPEVRSVNALTFGPEGILFIGDSRRAEIIAIDTKDNTLVPSPEKVDFKQVDKQIAALLGTTVDAINIKDMAVNPVSKKVYFAVHSEDGTPLIITLSNNKLELFPINEVSHSKAGLIKAVEEDAKDRRGRSLRQWAISDLAYYDGSVMVSGLSNEEFSSTFRSIAFPFKEVQTYASLEIYHAAHGRYETYAPIKTFMPYQIAGKDHLIASYTCTPLVIFPMDQMEPGKLTKGKTVAELGNRNTPLDIISYKKKDKEYILLANTSRALMKIDPEKIANFSSFLTTKVEESSATAGVEFLALPYTNVLQMDKMDDQTVVLLQRMSNGDLNLHTPDVRRL